MTTEHHKSSEHHASHASHAKAEHKPAPAEDKGFIAKAQETVTGAASTAAKTVSDAATSAFTAVKENPLTAAAVAGGVAAAVGGAVYASGKLGQGRTEGEKEQPDNG